MKTTIWFSRHQPTDAQIKEIEALGFRLDSAALMEGMRLGAVNIQNDDQVAEVAETLVNSPYDAIFGVFAVPLQEQIAKSSICAANLAPEKIVTGKPCYASWNASRSDGSGKMSFQHRRFCYVGHLYPCCRETGGCQLK